MQAPFDELETRVASPSKLRVHSALSKLRLHSALSKLSVMTKSFAFKGVNITFSKDEVIYTQKGSNGSLWTS